MEEQVLRPGTRVCVECRLQRVRCEGECLQDQGLQELPGKILFHIKVQWIQVQIQILRQSFGYREGVQSLVRRVHSEPLPRLLTGEDHLEDRLQR